jgi:regulator of nucleoside diphosphate kinase
MRRVMSAPIFKISQSVLSSSGSGVGDELSLERTVVSEIDRRTTEQRPPIVLTEADREKLSELLKNSPERESNAARFLREELGRADVAHQHVRATALVTMGSEVKYIDHESFCVREVQLVYPDQSGQDGCLSVLTSAGSALIGLGPGQSIGVVEDGIERRFTVLEVRSPSD